MKIAELYALINVKGGKEASSSMGGLLKGTMAAKAGLLALIAAMKKMSEAARKMGTFLDMYEADTGMSGEGLQRMSYQAAQAGVSIEELGGTLEKLQQQSTDILLGKGMPEAFMWLQIDPHDSPEKQLDHIGRKLREIQAENPALAKNFANQLGISGKLYYSMLEGSSDALNERFVMTQKEQKAMARLNREWNALMFYARQIGIKLGAAGSVLQGKFIKVLTNAVQGLGEIILRINDFISANEKLKTTIMAVGIALLAVWNQWLLAAAAIVLVLEDIFVYFEGGDSVTGRIMAWAESSEDFREVWEGIKVLFDIVAGTFRTAWDGLKMLVEGLKDMSTLEGVQKAMEKIRGAIGEAVNSFLKLTQTKAGQWLLNKIGAADSVNAYAEKRLGTDAYGGLSAAPVPATASGGNNTSNSVKVETNINYQGTGDPEADGRALAQGLNSEISDAYAQNGGLAAEA